MKAILCDHCQVICEGEIFTTFDGKGEFCSQEHAQLHDDLIKCEVAGIAIEVICPSCDIGTCICESEFNDAGRYTCGKCGSPFTVDRWGNDFIGAGYATHSLLSSPLTFEELYWIKNHLLNICDPESELWGGIIDKIKVNIHPLSEEPS